MPADGPGSTPASTGESGTAKGEVTRLELTRAQQVVARRMAESKATVPHLVLRAQIEMDAAMALCKRLEVVAATSDGAPPTLDDLVVKACGLALRQFPRANGAYRDGAFELYSRVNVGITLPGRDAPVVPTLYDADRKSLAEIARDARALEEHVEANKLASRELSGGTFTVASLARYAIAGHTAVIVPPQAAILAVGPARERPVVRAGHLATGFELEATLSCDHRILDPFLAGEFLARIRELLEHPHVLTQ